ncbi:MAG: Ser-Thr-rich GPI-anchored membrane family protein [Cyclobacteriaceae bacterium]
MKLWVCTIFLTLGLLQISYAQRVRNVVAEFQDQRVQIRYDLIGELPGQIFEVELYGSLDNFAKPLLYVEGDVGDQIGSGRSKSVYWDAQRELVSFSGDITFEVKARLVFSPLALTKPGRDEVAKRGERLEIRWLGRMRGERVHLDLYQNESKVLSIGSVANDGAHNWTIPRGLKPGSNYFIQIKGSRSAKSTNSHPFAIKRKVPLAAKFLPFAVVIPIAVVLMNKDNGSGEDIILPAPPGAPD